jgi:hypothetical protein
MKLLYLPIAFFILIGQSLTGQKSIKCLFNDLKKDEKSLAITVPGWLIKKGMNYAAKYTDEGDIALFDSIKDALKKVRILVINSTNKNHSKAFNDFYQKASKDNLELYASFKEENNKINIYINEKEESIKNFFLTVQGESEMVLLHIKADLPLKTFNQTNFSFHKNKIKNNED